MSLAKNAYFILMVCLSVWLLGCHAQKHRPHTLLLQQPEFYQTNPARVAGNPTGRFTLVEFFDYRCAACLGDVAAVRHFIEIDPQLRVVYRVLPIEGPDSVFVAKAAIASALQGKYLVFHNALMAVGTSLDPSGTFFIAKKLGMNLKQLKKAMDSQFVYKALQKNKRLARLLAIKGTPSYILARTDWHAGKVTVKNAVFFQGAIRFEQFKELLIQLNTQ